MVSQFLNQKAILWAANGVDDDGAPKVDAKVEINVRWERGRRESLDSGGNRVAIDSLVVVDREIPMESILWKGSMDEYLSGEYGVGTGIEVKLEQVVSYNETPDVKGRELRRTVSLIHYSSELPVLA